MAVATPHDVETSLMRTLDENEEKYVLDLLDRAERLIQSRIPDFNSRIESSQCNGFQNVVADIEAEAVARVFRAPDSGVFSSETEGNYSYSVNMQVASGLLDILDAEWRRLGVGGWGMLHPETDAYLKYRGRYGHGLNPYQFQYGWPAQDNISEKFDSNHPDSGWTPLGRVWEGL